MTKIIWMSDPHFQNQGTIAGLDPRVRLEAAIDHANAHHGDADMLILSGDLVGDDIDGDYAMIATYLGRANMPVYPMMGNNDDRDGLRRHLSLPDSTMPGFIQFALPTPGGLVICLDTHMIGSHAGEFCAARRQWLEDTLSTHLDIPAYIFMHHPPLALGLPMQDEIMLTEADTFLDIIGRHKQVTHLFMGHVHRPTSGSVRGVGFTTLGSLAFQAPAPRPAWDWDSFVAPEEAPQYGVVLIGDGNVVVQYTQFCRHDVGLTAY